MKNVSLVLLLLLSMMLSSCKTAKPIQTLSLSPAFITTREWNKHDDAYFSCWPAVCFQSHGIGCFDITPFSGQVGAGYDYKYHGGTRPCNCWWYQDCVYRGGVRFDIGALQGKNVVAAQLKWADRGACVTRLFVAEKSWDHFGLSPAYEIISPWPPDSTGAGQIEVGITVRDWVKGNAINHGWLFVGPDESFPNASWAESDAEISPPNIGTHSCTSTVGTFTLTVEFTD